jgi:hypothetical protein
MILLAAALAAVPAGPASGTGVSLGLGGGYFFPSGDWTAHPYGGFDQFGGSYTIQGDVEIRFTRMLGMALSGGYIDLSMSEWKDYASSRGDVLDASASILIFGVQFKPHLWDDEFHTLAVTAGLNYCIINGRETFHGDTYDYDFLKDSLGYTIGVEFDRDISENTALTVSASVLIVPGGIEYADGLKHTVAGLPLAVGIRHWF